VFLVCVSLEGAAATTAVVDTIVGTGQPGNNGDEGAASEINVGQTFGVTFGPDGHLYVTEVENHRVRRLDLATKRISTVAGNGMPGYGGDGGPAIQAALNEPYEIRFDQAGNMFVVEMMNHIVRRIDAANNTITTIAGTGQAGYSGDGGPARKAQLNRPHSIALDGAGNLYIADIANHRIRRVDLETGIIDSIAGNGDRQLPTDGQLAAGNPILGPRALFIEGTWLWIALREGHSVWRMNLRAGRLVHVAGSGRQGYDNGPAELATFNGPKGIAVDNKQQVFVVDTENQVIRRINTRTQQVDTVAGSGRRGFGGDGGPATHALLARPHGICVGGDGSLFVGDTENHRVRRVQTPTE
jgi:sugar lactone lactonase YvrE